MTPERWRRITAVFHAARGRDAAVRDAYLDDACASDPTLRAEVEALLAADGEAAGFGDRAVYTVEGEAPLAPGTNLGPYRVEALLGVGGMGEVYRARDSRLGRDVALKVLPRQLASDPVRRERLLKEARSAAALNHPNICTVHEVGHADDRDYVVFEHIEGQTLASVTRPGGLPLRELMDIFLPLSDALAYAHQRGLVHRDLKPANMMVSTRGLPKILDFGVAKGARTAGGAGAATQTTEHGLVIGTVGYMSPEQALGRHVDSSSDVFSFGCVMYELATGRRAFEGATYAEVTDAVLHAEPPPLSQLRPDLPRSLGQIVRRCLRKDAGARYQQMAAVAAELRDLQAGRHAGSSWLGRTADRIAASAAGGQPRVLAAVAGGLAVLVLAWALSRLAGDAPVPRLVNPMQVTVAASLEDYPTWSPDGRMLAYESNESGNWDIWVAPVGGGSAVNRTGDHRGEDRYPSWSPDGAQIAFWSNRSAEGYYLVPALGGPVQRLVSTKSGPGYYSPPQWSADGSELAYMMYEARGTRLDAFVEILSLATRRTRRIRLPGSTETRFDLAWSRDGRHLAYVDAGSESETGQLRLLRLADGGTAALTDTRANVRGPTFSADGRHVFYGANLVGAADVWRQRISDRGEPIGDPQRVTTAVEVRHAAFSPDGRRLAISKGRWVANIWAVPLLAQRTATWTDAEQITFEHAFIEFLDVSRDGRRFLFSSDRAGNQDIWTMTAGGEMTRLTADPAPEWAPRWSPDEREIAFYASRAGDREIWVMPAGGGPGRQLTSAPGLDATPAWSPDGRTLVFRSERTGNSEIWTVTPDGGAERQVTHDPNAEYGPAFSPDGRSLAYSSTRGGALELWWQPLDGGAAQRLSRSPTVSPVWSPDGRALYFSSAQDPPRVWGLSLDDRRERIVADLGGRRGSLSFQAPATDGKNLYFSWRADVGDIWVMDVAPP
jgi:Tol biopolymer transport system component